MKRFCIVFALLWLPQATPSAAPPERIVSMGLCTDQLLLLLAERRRIASLSLWSRDPHMSYLRDEVGDLPLNNASIEEVVRFEPDLVITSQFAAWDTAKMLRQLGYDVRQVPQAKSIAGVYELLRLVGGWTGGEAAAEEIIAGMRARLRRIEKDYAHRPAKSVIVYSPNGFTIGADTLENDIFIHAGYRNLAADMGIEGFQTLSLEKLIAADPDVLQIDRNLSRPDSMATAFLGHPVLEKTLRRRDRLRSICKTSGSAAISFSSDRV